MTSSSHHHSEHIAHPKYRPDIDGLRAVAVLSVVGYHAFPMWIKGGFIGVDIFFVISGFLISTIIFTSLSRNTFSFAEFYSRRIRRIFPALLVVLISCFVLGWFVLLANEYKQLGKHIAGSAGFISNYLFWNESGYFDSAADTKPLLHLWSLGIEEQFYVVWPLLLWAAWKQKLNCLTIMIVIVAISFALNLHGVQTDAVATFYSPQTRFWELIAGSLLAYSMLYPQNTLSIASQEPGNWLKAKVYPHAQGTKNITGRNALSLVGLVFIVVGLLRITKEGHYPGTWALLPTLGAVLIIAAGSQAWFSRKVLASRVLVWFGVISYPLYLWHWPLLSFARNIEGDTPSRNIRIAAVLISIVIAWLTYKLIERPLRFGKYGNAKAITLFVIMLGVGYLGYNTYQRDGLNFRFPNIVNELTQYQYDYSNDFRSHSCFLLDEEDFSKFGDCGIARDKSKRTILIWGDSHAAHLYRGYEQVFGADFNIIQRTSTLCPPIMGREQADRKYCKVINDKTLELIEREKPDRVVLSAHWPSYGADWPEVSKTIAKLRSIGIVNIDLIGPDPWWKDSLPKQLYNYYKNDPFHKIPTRMKSGLDNSFVALDLQMEGFAAKQEISYLSPAKILCNDLGCITRLGDTSESVMTWDAGHLTSMGSRYLVSQFPKN